MQQKQDFSKEFGEEVGHHNETLERFTPISYCLTIKSPSKSMLILLI